MDNKEHCDICGAELSEEDIPVHLCKICQNENFNL